MAEESQYLDIDLPLCMSSEVSESTYKSKGLKRNTNGCIMTNSLNYFSKDKKQSWYSAACCGEDSLVQLYYHYSSRSIKSVRNAWTNPLADVFCTIQSGLPLRRILQDSRHHLRTWKWLEVCPAILKISRSLWDDVYCILDHSLSQHSTKNIADIFTYPTLTQKRCSGFAGTAL